MPHESPDLIFGCGYLGQRVADHWRRTGRSVVAVTRSAERAALLQREGFIPYIADVCRPETLAELPAANRVLWAVGFDRTSGRTQAEVYVEGLKHVLERISSRCQRLIYVSSTSVYGQQDGGWVDETSKCEPTQPGGVCCLAGERLVQEFCPNSSVILRLAGIYGPGRLLAKIAELQAGQPLPGRPDAWLNLIHVDDAAAAVCAAADAVHPPGMALVVDDRPLQRTEYYARLAALIGAAPPQFDDAQPRRRGSGDLNKRCANRRLKEELRVALRYPTIEQGLPAALQPSD